MKRANIGSGAVKSLGSQNRQKRIRNAVEIQSATINTQNSHNLDKSIQSKYLAIIE